MKHDECIGPVQRRARLRSRGAAERATRATLETLAARLAGDEADDLAAPLPPEIGSPGEMADVGLHYPPSSPSSSRWAAPACCLDLERTNAR